MYFRYNKDIIFEYDESKSKLNKLKHGIDFKVAQELWKDSDLLLMPGKSAREFRLLAIAKLESMYWTAIITHRDWRVRIISVRRSRKSEIEEYESKDA